MIIIHCLPAFFLLHHTFFALELCQRSRLMYWCKFKLRLYLFCQLPLQTIPSMQSIPSKPSRNSDSFLSKQFLFSKVEKKVIAWTGKPSRHTVNSFKAFQETQIHSFQNSFYFQKLKKRFIAWPGKLSSAKACHGRLRSSETILKNRPKSRLPLIFSHTRTACQHY